MSASAPPQLADDATRQQNIVARIERLPFHRWHVKMRLIIGTATFFDGLDSLMIAYMMPVLIPLWKIKPTQIGLLISSGYAGQLFGSLFFGWYAEKKGRLPCLLTTIFLFSVASLLCSFSWAYAALFVFRFIQGIGLGGEVPVAATYINEMAKAKGRGRFVMVYELLFAFGLIVCAFVSWWIIPRFGWRVLFVVGAVIGLIVPVLQRRLPESPRWLASQRRLDEAEKILATIEDTVSEHGRRPLPPLQPTKAAAEFKSKKWSELFQGIYLRRTLTSGVIWFCIFFCGFGLTTWLPSLYTTVYHMPVSSALRFTMVNQAVGFTGTLVFAYAIDKVGRKKLFSYGFALCAVALLSLWQLGRVSPQTLLTLTACCQFATGGMSCAIWLYAPELFPTRMRALGSAVGTAWYRVAVVLAPIFVGLIVTHYSLASAFAMFGSVAAFGAIITSLFAVETRGRVLEEVSP
jgi:putative MFS transporter